MKDDDTDSLTSRALVVVPSEAARVQDLGPFRSGRLLETDILPGSALLCRAEAGGTPLRDADGLVRFAFEGNAVRAVNAERFHEKCLIAAGRLATSAPSIAYGRARPEDLLPVADYDLLRYVFTGLRDAAAIEAWTGEPVDSFLPPAELGTPVSDPEITGPLSNLPLKIELQGKKGVFAWTLADGTILTMTGIDRATGRGTLTAWRPGDPGLRSLLLDGGLEAGRALIIT